MRFRLSSTLKRLKTSMKTETFENGFKSGDIWKRFVSSGQVKTETFENSDVKSVTCHRFQSKSEHLSKMADGRVMLTHARCQVPVVLIVFERSSVDRPNDTQTLVWMKIFCFLFAEMKTDTFVNTLVCMGPQLTVPRVSRVWLRGSYVNRV